MVMMIVIVVVAVVMVSYDDIKIGERKGKEVRGKEGQETPNPGGVVQWVLNLNIIMLSYLVSYLPYCLPTCTESVLFSFLFQPSMFCIMCST